jgi:cytochrome c peroxidase
MRDVFTALGIIGMVFFAAGLPANSQGQAPFAPTSWSDAERALIASHGPWPAKVARDPTNRVSGNSGNPGNSGNSEAAVSLGARLFNDTRLSANGTVSCQTCHQTDRDFTDGLAISRGLGSHQRNAPTLWNVGLQRWFGWDGASDSLWAHSIAPILASNEMGGSAQRTADLLRSDDSLRGLYQAAFLSAIPSDDTTAMVDAAKALAAYQETLISPESAFDRFASALARNDSIAMLAYPENAQRGLKIFIGQGRCGLCHSGPLFTNGEFADIGLKFFNQQGVDRARFGGIQKLWTSPFNALGAFNDAPNATTQVKTRQLTLEDRHFGEFKVPSLRRLNKTAPYMHDGSLPTLEAVVQHYSNLDDERLHADGQAILVPLKLSAADAADLVAFLRSLDF